MSNLGFLIVGNPKMITIFHYRVTPPPPPPRASLGAVWMARGDIPPRIMCYVNSEVFNSGESKNDHHFHFRLPPTPTRTPPGPRGGLECCGKFIFFATFFLPMKGSRNKSLCSFKSIDNTYWIIKSLIKIWILINMDISCVYFQTMHWIRETKTLNRFVVLSKYIRNHSKNQNLDFGYSRENKEKS